MPAGKCGRSRLGWNQTGWWQIGNKIWKADSKYIIVAKTCTENRDALQKLDRLEQSFNNKICLLSVRTDHMWIYMTGLGISGFRKDSDTNSYPLQWTETQRRKYRLLLIIWMKWRMWKNIYSGSYRKGATPYSLKNFTHLGLEDAAAKMARMEAVEAAGKELEKILEESGRMVLSQKMFKSVWNDERSSLLQVVGSFFYDKI